MNNAFFAAGVKATNTAVAVADRTKATAQAAKHYATKGVDSTVRGTKTVAETTKVCSMSFMDGVRHALAMNKALNK